MKKLVSLLLTLVMVLGLSTSLFAATTNLTIDATDDSDYNGYQLLKLETTLKDADHNTTCTKPDHTECYYYDYSVNEKYEAILQKEVFDEADGNFRADIVKAAKPENADGISEFHILEYLRTLTSDDATSYGTLRDAADRIYRAIKEADPAIADDGNFEADTQASIEQGYWLIADVTDLANDAYNANSLVMLDTMGADNVTVTPKTALPTMVKKVLDTNDSSSEADVWQDSADHDIGDAVSFKLTATLPGNVNYYDSYKIVFHDTLSSALTLDSTSLKVWMYDDMDAAKTDIVPGDDAADGTDVTDSFTTSTTADCCSFEVSCENVLAINGVNKDTVFAVYYQAALDTDAAIGAAGNPNEAYLEFSNNPYGDETGNTAADKVTVFTYRLTINKTDAGNTPLAGAGFTLYKKDAAGSYAPIGKEVTGENKTSFTWTGLDDGDYKLVESTVPTGYNKMEDIEFTITAEHDAESDDPQLTSLNGGDIGKGILVSGNIEKDIVNQKGTVLPETGAGGTMLLIGGGAMFVLLAAIFMITRKKMSVYED